MKVHVKEYQQLINILRSVLTRHLGTCGGGGSKSGLSYKEHPRVVSSKSITSYGDCKLDMKRI